MGDFNFTGQPSGRDRYSTAYREQGFREPIGESPFPNPDGWHGGHVHQTGGMIMVREWSTCPGLWSTHRTRPCGDVEYEVAYGSNPGVSIQRYKWHPDQHGGGGGWYIFDDTIASKGVSQNTDRAKAKAARELMLEFNRGMHK